MSSFTEEELINLLINSQDFLELMAVYYMNIEQLRKYTIIAFDNQMTETINPTPPLDLTQKIKSASIVSIFKSSFCVLNEEISNKLLKGIKADFEYIYCLDLDLNMMNILVNYHNEPGKNTDLDSILSDLNSFNNDVSCTPYLVENALKINNIELKTHVVETMLIFNKYKRSTLSTFSPDYPNTEQDYQDTKKALDMMKQFASTENDIIFAAQKYIYALLLKTTLISFCNNHGIAQKILELVEFINNESGLFLERETVICYWFLKNRNDKNIAKFFKGIQLNAKDIIKTIQGMSWDLFHLRFCIEMGMATDLRENQLCLHYLITQDHGLADLTNAHPIKYMLFKQGDIAPKIIFAEPIYETITEIDIIQNLQKNSNIRNETYNTKSIDVLIKHLEQDIINLQTTRTNTE